MKKNKSTNANLAAKIDHWTQQYRTVVDSYEAYVLTLKNLIAFALKQNGIEYPEISGRAKDILSFREKIQRPGKFYKDPLSEITDLAGIRIVVQYEDEIEKVNKIIQSEFDVDQKNSIDKREQLEIDRFGYRSVHVIVEMGQQRTSLREYQRFKGLKAEVQIRTVLQHAWAAAEHTLIYKNGRRPDPVFHRKFVRLASLLELVDEQFVSLRESEQGRWVAVAKDVKNGKLSHLNVDTITLNCYCKFATLPNTIQNIANKLNIQQHPQHDERQVYKDFMGVCELCSIQTILSLDQRLRCVLDDAEAIFSARNTHVKSNIGRPWLTSREYLITTLLIASHRPALNAASIQRAMDIDQEFVDGILYARKNAYKKHSK